MAYEVPGWLASTKRKPIGTSKFYFFDCGVARFLQNRPPVRAGSAEFGALFENYIFHELKTFSDYHGAGTISYWRSKSGFEVDFVLADKTAVEVKASRTIGARDLRGLRALAEEKGLKNYVLVCLERAERTIDGIQVLALDVFN